ncbi:Rof/RNase P-like protein [Infundibulicybe gibba]|nr:Rof/RNase P-like protein [Infundibulicybe gibba]
MNSDQQQPTNVGIYKGLTFIEGERPPAPFTPTFVTTNLSQVSNPVEIYASRVRGRQIVLENPVRESQAKKKVEERKAKLQIEKQTRKRGTISKKEAKKQGLWKLDESHAKYELFLPLHHLWMGYMSELLGLSQKQPSLGLSDAIPSFSGMHPKLLKADFHGSIIIVRQSKNPCLVGLSGIVIHETENAFKVITKRNESKLIPKQNSIFAFAVPLFSTLLPSHNQSTPLPVPDNTNTQTVLDSPHLEFELYGNQFRFRSADRAGRKFKHKESIEL